MCPIHSTDALFYYNMCVYVNIHLLKFIAVEEDSVGSLCGAMNIRVVAVL